MRCPGWRPIREALRQLDAWAGRLADAGQFGEMEALILQIGFGEYLAQIAGGIPMSQGEIARLSDLGLTWTPGEEAARLMAQGNTASRPRRTCRPACATTMAAPPLAPPGLDEELEMIRDQFRRYADEKVIPVAHDWHLKDELIPMEVIEELAEMGVFGLTIPEEFGGFGLSKASMVVVSRRTVARLYRRRLAWHPVRDRGRTDPVRRHRRAKGAMAAEAGLRRNPADRRLHRTQHRL